MRRRRSRLISAADTVSAVDLDISQSFSGLFLKILEHDSYAPYSRLATMQLERSKNPQQILL